MGAVLTLIPDFLSRVEKSISMSSTTTEPKGYASGFIVDEEKHEVGFPRSGLIKGHLLQQPHPPDVPGMNDSD
jgi:hypothetical protein